MKSLTIQRYKSGCIGSRIAVFHSLILISRISTLLIKKLKNYITIVMMLKNHSTTESGLSFHIINNSSDFINAIILYRQKLFVIVQKFFLYQEK